MRVVIDIFKNKVTRNAIFLTLALLFVYRIGSFIVTPGIDPTALLSVQEVTSEGIATIFNFFGGGNITQMTLFALGVSPYITASIVIQLLENELVPSMNEWKHQGVDGQNKRSNYTKYFAIVLAFIQSIGIAFGYYVISGTTLIQDNNYFIVAVIMTAGTASLMWIGDRITEKGIGNGISVLIMAGIIARMPQQANEIYATISNLTGTDAYQELLIWLVIAIITLIVIIMVIYYNLAYRKIPINYVRNSIGSVRKNSYLPIKLNPAGVIPVIFAGPLILILNVITTWLCDNLNIFTNDGAIGTYEQIIRSLFGGGEYWILYVIVYAAMIIAFSIFYSFIQMNPENMAQNLEKQSAYVIGVRPGEDTEQYLSDVIIRTTVWGAIILAFLAVLPIIITNIAGLTISMTMMGTGLIIVVSVLVQTFQSLKNKVESKKYRNLIG